MKFSITITAEALEELRVLPVSVEIMITKKLTYFVEQSNPMRYAKPLSGRLDGKYRFRIGEYRAIFRKEIGGELTILNILKIAHRKDIYQ